MTASRDTEAAKGDTTTRETTVTKKGSHEDQQELGHGQERTTEETRHASDSSTLELEQSASVEQENQPAASWKKGTPLQHDWTSLYHDCSRSITFVNACKVHFRVSQQRATSKTTGMQHGLHEEQQ
jgi:hypothetical protein